jgi:predicted XRE-type DNA-binding protein
MELAKISNEMSARPDLQARLETVRDQLRNRPPQTRGAFTSRKVDLTVRRQIVDLHQTRPDLPQHEIAKITGVNQGRVSEILAGKRA